ncbi:glycoside hydrolase family 71 protein [Hebeloma cylindrosporum]|uniref:Glycoside hydrolase family 71 protein n=1 Tax=Hebeloma cylindrosporum TaxID=76867 RepID=A0A0C2Y030_HEBCY|nr:glycoside hydrolase family 71 protein [Hebeloma cylindrosporum h7]
MQLRAPLFCLLTLFFSASAYVIPLRRVRIPSNIPRSPSENDVFGHRNPRFAMKRQEPSIEPNNIITLVAAGSTPTSTRPFIEATLTTSTIPTSQPFPSSDVSPAPIPSSTLDSTTTVDAASQPSQPPIDSDGSRKYVVAHHMVGNTFPYTPQDWADDIALAHASGIDGFALNMGTDDWQPARVADAYEAAKQSGLDFKLFISLDMSSFPCGSPNDAQNLRNIVNAHVSHPNQLQYASRAFVSTFAGESCNFGQGSVPDGWKNQFTRHPDLQGKIYFVPAFFIDPTTFKNFADVMDGDFNWNSGWPIQVTSSFAQNVLAEQSNNKEKPNTSLITAGSIAGSLANQVEAAVASTLTDLQQALTKFIGSIDTDDEHLSGLEALQGALQARDGESSKRAYMGAVSPWFFTHYGADSFNKNFVYLADQHLYSKRWESLIGARDQFDIVQVLTWNDYGESHYVGPVKGAQPNSQAWTDGMNHTAWLELTQYYSTAFKTGQYPTIEKDKIVMWSRPHSTAAESPDPVPKPTNFDILQDAVWAVVMTTAPSTVTLSVSPTSFKTFNVPAGVSKLAIPITPGGTMKGVIQRGGKTIVELNPTQFTFQGSPQSFNFNAFVASAAAD